MKPHPQLVGSAPGAGTGAPETARLYDRLQRLGILARCNPHIPALADAYWRLSQQLSERDPHAADEEER